MLLNDYRDFLVEFRFQLLEIIPENLKHFRNIVLSAVPMETEIVDPF